MIDTIKININQSPATSVEQLLKNKNPDWTYTSKQRHHSHTGEVKVNTWGIDKHKVTKVSFSPDGNLTSLESSLPCQFRANGIARANGIQIKTSSELTLACDILFGNVITICPTVPCYADSSPFRSGQRPIQKNDLPISRIDLALNLKYNPRTLLTLHRHARHRRIRREVQSYSNVMHRPGSGQPFEELNTVRFNGVNTTIIMYDKVREMFAKNNRECFDTIQCVRVEIQLRGPKHIAKMFGREDSPFTLADLDFWECYRLYRSILCEFDSIGKIPQFKPDSYSFLAVLESSPETWKYFGDISPLEWWRARKNLTDKHFNELRLKVGRQVLNLSSFRWTYLLPNDRLPDIVDVDENGIQTIIPSADLPPMPTANPFIEEADRR